MALPKVANAGDGPQMWMVPANLLDKQSHTADKGLVWVDMQRMSQRTSDFVDVCGTTEVTWREETIWETVIYGMMILK
jgi:hypothetical protein